MCEIFDINGDGKFDFIDVAILDKIQKEEELKKKNLNKEGSIGGNRIKNAKP